MFYNLFLWNFLLLLLLKITGLFWVFYLYIFFKLFQSHNLICIFGSFIQADSGFFFLLIITIFLSFCMLSFFFFNFIFQLVL